MNVWPPRSPWWKRIKLAPAIAVATAILGLGSAAIWFIHDANSLFPGTELAEGSLQVNINTATQAELESIPGIGESLASQIIVNRPYSRIEDLEQISGIGPRSLEGFRPFMKVEGETKDLR